MEDIRFYNFEGRLLAIVHDAVTVSWRICYNDIGSFEAHFSLHSSFVSEIAQQPWLVAVQGELQAIITGRQIGEELVLYGKTPNWLLTKRVIPPFVTGDIAADTQGEVTVSKVVQWVFSQCFDDQDPVVQEQDEGGFSQEQIVFWRNTANSAFEVIRDCAQRDRGGHRIVFDPSEGNWRFQLYKGRERELFLSEDNRNAYETVYSEDIIDLADAGWYGRELNSRGDYDPVENRPPLKDGCPENFGKYYRISQAGSRFGLTMGEGDYLLCDTPQGQWRVADGEEIQQLDCIWLKLQGPKENSGIYRWDSVLDAQTQSSAEAELKEKKKNQEITLVTRDVLYGREYGLGDIVRVQKSSGGVHLVQTKQIEAVNIWYEQGNSGQQPEFGEVQTGEEN